MSFTSKVSGFQIYITTNRSKTLEEFNRFLFQERATSQNIENRQMKAQLAIAFDAIMFKMRGVKEIPENGLIVQYHEALGVTIMIPPEPVKELEYKLLRDGKALY